MIFRVSSVAVWFTVLFGAVAVGQSEFTQSFAVIWRGLTLTLTLTASWCLITITTRHHSHRRSPPHPPTTLAPMLPKRSSPITLTSACTLTVKIKQVRNIFQDRARLRRQQRAGTHLQMIPHDFHVGHLPDSVALLLLCVVQHEIDEI